MLYDIGDLLPYARDVLLNSLNDRLRLLQLLKFLYQLLQETVEAFFLKKFHEFDAQVSENLCQIRAYQLANIICECDGLFFHELSNLRRKAKSVCVRCNSLYDEYKVFSRKRPSHYSKDIDNSITLEKMLQDYGLNIKMPELIYILVQQYILSKYKLVGKYNISTGINYDALCFDINIISKTFARKVIHGLQRNVSKNSCQFIFNLCSHLKRSQKDLSLLKMLYFQDEVGRHVLSCYEVTKIILKHAYRTGKYIKIIVTLICENREENITFFLKKSRQKRYLLAENEGEVSDYGLMTFAGISRDNKYKSEKHEEYIARFMKVGFENIIMANMAQHPQYAGLHLKDKKINPYLMINFVDLHQQYIDHIKKSESRFLHHKDLSCKIGCSQENPGLFLLTHVRCGDVLMQFDKVEKQDKSWQLKYLDLHGNESCLTQGVYAYE